MNFFTKYKTHLSIMAVLILLNGFFANKLVKNIISKNSMMTEGEFHEAVKNFCNGKSITNFCSPEHLKLIFEVEKKRREQLEMERQMKRMESEVAKKLAKMFEKSKQTIPLLKGFF
jgi:hypothetical protein